MAASDRQRLGRARARRAAARPATGAAAPAPRWSRRSPGHDCAVTALELDDELRRRKPPVGRASVYRALEQLEQLGLVQRLEVTAAAPPATSGSSPAASTTTTRSAATAAAWSPSRTPPWSARSPSSPSEISFEVAEHDVVLRGRCERAALADPRREE